MSDEFLVKKQTRFLFVCITTKNNILGAHTKADILPGNLHNAGEGQPDVLSLALSSSSV